MRRDANISLVSLKRERNSQHGEIPALRLFFTIDDGAIVLLTIETYDELL